MDKKTNKLHNVRVVNATETKAEIWADKGMAKVISGVEGVHAVFVEFNDSAKYDVLFDQRYNITGVIRAIQEAILEEMHRKCQNAK